MYFEIYQKHNLIKRGTVALNELRWEHELMSVPQTTLTLPIDYLEYVDGREEIKIFVNDKCFWGIIKDIDVNKADETIELSIEHVISEWEYRQVSVNHAIQDGTLNILYKGAKTVTNSNLGEAITASDFRVTQKEFDAATNAFLVERASARAWKTGSGDPVAITSVEEVLDTSTTEKLDNLTQPTQVSLSTKGNAVVNYAKEWLGTPYVLGGSSKNGIDCSGLTMRVYERFGITLPHYSQDQKNYGVAVSQSDAQPGDLIFYPGHVAIYIGNGQRIHANGTKVVIDSNPWKASVTGIRRLLDTSYDKSKTRMYDEEGYGSKVVNGQKKNAVFTAYYPGENGEYVDSQGKKLDAKKLTCAAPSNVPINTQIQIASIEGRGYGTYRGRIYTVNDRGSAIIVDEQGRYHIDLLVKDAATANKFGRREGTIIISDGTGYHYDGSTKSTTSDSRKWTVTFATAKGTSISVEMTIDEESPGNDSEDEASVIDNIADIYHDANFYYPGWTIDLQDDSGDRMVDYVYSKQNKLEALTKTMELTEDLFWRVGFTNEKRVEIGKFGKKKPYILSVKPSSESNIRIIQEPKIDYDFANVVNVATVISSKSDGGMASLTLREVYNDPSLQIDGFPVVILRPNVNNERDYTKYVNQYPKLAPNNELEFAILDEESIALEAGELIEGSYAFNDLSPSANDSKKVTDAQRKRTAVVIYKAGIKKLKQVRRSKKATLTTEEIPSDINVGDQVRLLYDNSIWHLDACSNYEKKILTMDDWFYVTKISYDIDGNSIEVNELTLEKYIKVEREGSNQ